MVLFEKDFAEQGAIVHYATSNKSAIKMHMLLKQMGIKNNKFFLALYQKDLEFVNPHDKNLSSEDQFKIAYECKINPWYFFREVARVPAQGEDGIHYAFDRANLSLNWLFLNSVDVFMTIARQIGKTIGTITLETYIMYIMGKNLNVALFAKDNDLVLENVDRMKAIRDFLPKYMIYPTTSDTNNKEGVTYAFLNNKYKTFIAQADTKRAAGQGRGPSISMEHWDELAWYVNNHLSYPAAVSATDTAGEQVRAAGIPCCNIITTTAGKLDDPRGKYAYGIKSDAMPFSEILYDQPNQEALKQTVDENSNNLMVYVEFSYKQLGKDEDWFRRVTRGKDQERVDMDYLNKWIHGSGKTVLPKAILDKLNDCKMEPTTHTYFKSLILKWYINPTLLKNGYLDERPLVLASDTSDNVGRDFTTLLMLDPKDLSVVCTCRCNQSNLTYVAKCVYQMLKKHKGCVFIPERNKNGAMMVDMILEMSEGDVDFNPFKRIYNKVVNDSEMAELGKYHRHHGRLDNKLRPKFGFTTSSGANGRDMLYSNVLTAALELNASRVYDSVLVDELNGLTTRKGRIDHTELGHDDMVISFLLSCYLILRAKNIEFYGLSLDNVLTDITNDGEVVDPVVKKTQLGYKHRIEELTDLIEKVKSPALQSSYTRELEQLRRKIKDIDVDNMVVSVNQIEQETQEKNKERTGSFNDASFKLLGTFL